MTEAALTCLQPLGRGFWHLAFGMKRALEACVLLCRLRLLVRRLSWNLEHRPALTSAGLGAALAVIVACISKGTLVHPYLLADNR